MTRPGAGKVVVRRRGRGYMAIADSVTSGGEKSVTLTRRGERYVEALPTAAGAIERQLRDELGETEFTSFYRLLDSWRTGRSTAWGRI